MKDTTYDTFLDISKWETLDDGSRFEREPFENFAAEIYRFGDGWTYRANRIDAGDGVSVIAHYGSLGYSEALEQCCSEICKAVHDNYELGKARSIR